jgi:hypothetical protein
MLKKYLGLSDSEIKDNEKMWHEEMGKAPIPSAAGTDLRNVGVTPGAITGDLDNLEGLEGLDAPEAQPGSPLPGVEAPAGGAVGAAPGAAAALANGGAKQAVGTTQSAAPQINLSVLSAPLNAMINEIKALRADMASGKIAVHMDGAKVTAGVSNQVNKSTRNNFAIA